MPGEVECVGGGGRVLFHFEIEQSGNFDQRIEEGEETSHGAI